ncbi:RIP metalloprotease RseP [Anaerovorax odorimutans]|uniref:RIP metalloprotease RseP n=1 Tax=Anaerovorax odorimutans TaxID=109327 RepID=UPI00041ED305|nr:RIP metalloprotease RseP [Anaerovorax odorimutans]
MMIIYAILIFCLLIFIHEFGHFITAKAVGIKVNEFALGMGPLLLHFTKGETEYSLRALPIGGYCKMEGEDEESDSPRAFNNKPFWAKAIVIVAGSFMNLVLAVVILSIIVFYIGVPNNIIKEVTPDYPAVAAGLKSGDKIIKIDNNNIKNWDDLTSAISESGGDSITIGIERDGKTMTLESAVITGEDNRRVIGISPEYERDFSYLGQSVVLGAKSTYDMGLNMIQVIGQLVTREISVNALTGPVGIIHIVGDTAKLGIIYVAQLTAFISLNLAIVNMLPFPALDGGRLLFMVIRLFTGKAISDELEGKIHLIGILLLFTLMIYITFQDVGRFIL